MKSAEATFAAGLTVVASVLALAMAYLQLATPLEAASFVTGAVCVWLTVKQDIRSFPLGLVNAATYCVVFYRSRLYADSGLQVVYFVLGVMGWYAWLHGGKNRSQLPVSRITRKELAFLIVFVAAATAGLWHLLEQWGGSASFWDALTTSLSLASQWLINRKRLESWIGWIQVDAIYVPLYVYKELYLTAALYGVFLIMAVIGLLTWRASWQKRLLTAGAHQPLEGVAP